MTILVSHQAAPPTFYNKIAPMLARNVFVGLCLQIFSHKVHENVLFGDKKVFMCFSANVGSHFLNQTTLGAFLSGFSGILPEKIKTLLGVRFSVCTPASYTTVWPIDTRWH